MKRRLALLLWICTAWTPLEAETVQYQVDDGTFEGRIDPPEPGDDAFVEAFRVAQRFTVERAGRLAEVGACFWRQETDPWSTVLAFFNLHRDADGRPGDGLIPFDDEPVLLQALLAGEYTCLKNVLRYGFSYNLELEPGDYWVSVHMPESTLFGEPKRLAADWNGPGRTSVASQALTLLRAEGEGEWSEWSPTDPKIRAVGIRFAVQSGDPGPEPGRPDDYTGVTHYQEDDGSFENDERLLPWHDWVEAEVAQRFEVGERGRLRYLEACFERAPDDTEAKHAFSFLLHDSIDGLPGARIVLPDDPRLLVEIPRGEVSCVRHNLPTPVELVPARNLSGDAGVFWASVRFASSERDLRDRGLGGKPKRLGIDYSSPDYRGGMAARVAFRIKPEKGAFWTRFEPPEGLFGQAVGIRMGIQHGDEGTDSGDFTDCQPTSSPLEFTGGYEVRMCYETPAGDTGEGKSGIWASDESGLLWFFNRDNAEVLVKVLDGCAINGHRWVFVAPATDLAFHLEVVPPGGGEPWTHRNPQGRTAEARSDTTAFECGSAVRSTAVASVRSRIRPVEATPLAAVDGSGFTDCDPETALLVFDGYEVRLCYETPEGLAGEGNRGWASGQSGLLWFFNQDNAEVLVKVLDGCAINGHRWVFVAPATDLAFQLEVVHPDGGEPWTHRNSQGRTAMTRSDISAFPCSAEPQ